MPRREIVLKGYDRPVGLNVLAAGMGGGDATAAGQATALPML